MANFTRAGRLIPGVFVTTGNPDTVNDAAPSTTTVGSSYDLRGQLGALYRSNDGLKEWLYVQFSSTSTGKTPAANQICYWLSSTSTTATSGTWVVDNQTSASSANVNQPAGILRVAATRGNYVWLLRKAPSALVVSTSTLYLKGDTVVCTTASGEASTVGSTSTAIQTSVAATPWFFLGGAGSNIGHVNSTTTSGITIDTVLNIG